MAKQNNPKRDIVNLGVDRAVYKQLQQLKLDNDLKTISDAISLLLKDK